MTVYAGAILLLLGTAVLLFGALHDIAFRTIPNWVPLALTALGGTLRLLDHRLPSSLACGLIVFVLAALCWTRGWLGGGDVKLLGAAAILVPPFRVPGFIAAVALAGGALAMIYLVLARLLRRPGPGHRGSAGRDRPLPYRILAAECHRIRRHGPLPYAAAISAAAIMMLAEG